MTLLKTFKNGQFIDFQAQVGSHPKVKVFYYPQGPQRWRVQLWAKRGSFIRETIVDCDEPMDVTEFIETYMPEISSAFVREFIEAVDVHAQILRMENRFADAYDFANKKSRFGYRAFEEGFYAV